LRQRTTELEARNEELTRFAYVASHNLRAPLVNLEGFVGELHRTLDAMTPAIHATLPHMSEEQRRTIATALEEDIPEALSFIDSSVGAMNRMNNALLELSNASRRTLVMEPVDMNALVHQVLEGLSGMIEERGGEVIIGNLPSVVADRVAMKRIMENLLSNAFTYLDKNRPGKIEVTAESNNSEVIFSVRDNGRGIAEDDIEKVLTPFRRAGKSRVPGEGMGLAYAQTLIRRHGGRIWCESELGMGTTFTFTVSNHSTKGSSYV
jgi:signal transduction histidine kinase